MEAAAPPPLCPLCRDPLPPRAALRVNRGIEAGIAALQRASAPRAQLRTVEPSLLRTLPAPLDGVRRTNANNPGHGVAGLRPAPPIKGIFYTGRLRISFFRPPTLIVHRRGENFLTPPFGHFAAVRAPHSVTPAPLPAFVTLRACFTLSQRHNATTNTSPPTRFVASFVGLWCSFRKEEKERKGTR